MKTKAKTQIQVRIDAKTKKDAKRVLEDIGMDASTAVNILFRYIARSGTFPIDLRDMNGLRSHKAQELREAMVDSKQSRKSFKDVKGLMADLRA